MMLDKFLVIRGERSRYGGLKLTAKLAEREPNMDGKEIALHLQIEIPEALFKRPYLQAKMKLPDELVPKLSITPEITTNLERIIKERTGLEMVVRVSEHDKKYPLDNPDDFGTTGDFSNLQDFKTGQKVRFYSKNDPRFSGIHTILEIQNVEVGTILRTDKSGETWIHAHWFAPVKK